MNFTFLMLQAPIDYSALAPKPPEGPINFSTIFKADVDVVELEIGFGRGQFILQRAKECPRVGLIGLEIKHKWAYRVYVRATKAELKNTAIWAADAKQVVSRMPEHSVSRVFVHFPDPWWKKRHTKRMLLDAEFIEALARIIVRGGELFVQTDVEERARNYKALLEASSSYVIDEGSTWLTESPFQAQANRETRAIADGLPIWRMLAQRR